jgi:Zinc finger, C3HC4 type (RING finger)
MEDLERLDNQELIEGASSQNPTAGGGNPASTENKPVIEEMFFPEYLVEPETENPPAQPQPPAPANPVAVVPNREVPVRNRGRGNRANNANNAAVANPPPPQPRVVLTTSQVLLKKHTFSKFLIFTFTLFAFWKTLSEERNDNCEIVGHRAFPLWTSVAAKAERSEIATSPIEEAVAESVSAVTNTTAEAVNPTEQGRTSGGGWGVWLAKVPYIGDYLSGSWLASAWESTEPESPASSKPACNPTRFWYYWLLFADVMVGLFTIGTLDPKPLGKYFIDRWFGLPFFNIMTSKACITISILMLSNPLEYEGEGWYWTTLNLIHKPACLILATWKIGYLFTTHRSSTQSYKGLQPTYLNRNGILKMACLLFFNLLPAKLVALSWCYYLKLISPENYQYWTTYLLDKLAWTGFGFSSLITGIGLVIGLCYLFCSPYRMCQGLYFTGLAVNYSVDVSLVYVIYAMNQKQFIFPKIGDFDSAYVLLIVFVLKGLNLIVHNDNINSAILRGQLTLTQQTLIDLQGNLPESSASGKKKDARYLSTRIYKRHPGHMKKLIVPEWFNKQSVDGDSLPCCICMSRRSNCVILPCFHSELCHTCAVDIMKDTSRRCYLCLRGIASIHRVKIDFDVRKDTLHEENQQASEAGNPAASETNKPDSKNGRRFDKGLITAELMSFE